MLQNWGQMTKAQDDATTIDQAIASAIFAHENDPESHMGVGESIENHRQNEVIDHPANSVVDDKINIEKFSLQDWFASLSAYDVSGLAFSRLGYAEFYTTTVLNNVTYVYLPADDNYNLACDVSKNPIFETVCFVNSSEDFQSDIGFGDIGGDYYVSFRITKTTSNAVWTDDDGVEHLISLTDITKGVLHKLRIEIYSGAYISWFVDGFLVAQVDISAVVLGDMRGWIFAYRIETLHIGNVARIGVFRVLYQQDL